MAASSEEKPIEGSLFEKLGKVALNSLHETQVPSLNCLSDITENFEQAKEPSFRLDEVANSFRREWQQLIVLGNGFDLQCGLKSRFRDFFEPRFEKIKSVSEYGNEYWKTFISNNGLTLWDFILRENDKSLWCDVEGTIEKWVLSAEERSKKGSIVNKAIAAIGKHPFDRTPTFSVNGRLLEEQDDEAFMFGSIARCSLVNEPTFAVDERARERFLVLLKEELHKLEEAFKKYLKDEVSSNSDYVKKCQRLYKAIENDNKASCDDFCVSTSVLSFNYTNLISCFFDGGEYGTFVNIHGDLDNEIIFGIDGKECMDNPEAVKFTKTYRLMQRGGADTENLINTANSFNLQNATDVIKFYGHSLGPADYSYFQSIFDGVDLYESNTVLVFYYPTSESEDLLEQYDCYKTDLVNAINQLLVAYGATMNNRDHGKNLMHKLLIEGRLFLRPILIDDLEV